MSGTEVAAILKVIIGSACGFIVSVALLEPYGFVVQLAGGFLGLYVGARVVEL